MKIYLPNGKGQIFGFHLSNKDSQYANAFVDGYSACSENITVPRSLTNKEGETMPVEVVGQSAYYNCGLLNYGYKTKSVLITKQVKVIKYYGFGEMRNVESFRIEEGSVLETVENLGLHYIGRNTGMNDEKKRGTLILPSTLSSVAVNGIYICNLFNVIIFCGTHALSNSCDLEYSSASSFKETEVKVTSHYPESTIFGRTAIKDSPDEVEEECYKIIAKQTPSIKINSALLKQFLLLPHFFRDNSPFHLWQQFQ